MIVDEAHSSQTGEAAKDLKLVARRRPTEQELTAAEAEDAGSASPRRSTRWRRRSPRQAGARGQPAEPVVLRVHRDAEGQDARAVRHAATRNDRQYEPFHLYSMRQAIEEGFILDVLANYTTYDTYWQIEKAIRGRPGVRVGEGHGGDRPVRDAAPAQPGAEGRDHRRALPRSTPRSKIGGQAKAMVVTSSRLHAVRYKQAIDALHRRRRATTTSAPSSRSPAR